MGFRLIKDNFTGVSLERERQGCNKIAALSLMYPIQSDVRIIMRYLTYPTVLNIMMNLIK